jgi:exodeoxyribonuclease VII large subunit
MSKNIITLYEFNREVKTVLKNGITGTRWVTAEISDLNINRSGHCYLELVEKDEVDERIIAKARGIIWAYTFNMIRPYFETVAGQELSSGMKIMMNVTVEFHELYGFSLLIKDIDPSYTLGDIARRKLEVLQKLEEEGILEMNKSLPHPLVFQKIAIISSPTAAGYGDFIDQLDHNAYGYTFYHKLFPAVMQGEQTESSIIAALERIFQYEDFFDGVVIIRGGGAKSDLHVFNNYGLASHICQFPLPVVTGIGHERDESVVDIIAHHKLKTPTAVAEFLIGKMIEFDNELKTMQDDFLQFVEQYMTDKEKALHQLIYRLHTVTRHALSHNQYQLESAFERLNIFAEQYVSSKKRQIKDHVQNTAQLFYTNQAHHKNHLTAQLFKCKISVQSFLNNKQHQTGLFENTLKYIDPENVLKRGFTLTTHQNKIIKNVHLIKQGDHIETHLFKGKITSTVNKINN